MNKLEKIYKEIKEKDDIEKTSIIFSNLFIQTDYNFCVFISISIPIMTAVEKMGNEAILCPIRQKTEMKRFMPFSQLCVKDIIKRHN
jgi:hypothetical protein